MKTILLTKALTLTIFFITPILLFQLLAKEDVQKKKGFQVKEPLKIGAYYDRDSLRAFYTAPPVIPHEAGNGMTSRECLHCHNDFKQLGDRQTVKTPHAHLSNCQQCHVASKTNPVLDYQPTKNNFVGLKEPQKGKRGHIKGPPMMPHRVFMREDCATCHSNSHPNKNMRTPHPERSNCVQCHLPLKENEF